MARKKKDEPAENDAAKPAKEEATKKKGGLLPALVVAIAVLGAGAMAGGVLGGGGEAAEAAPVPTATPTPEPLGAVIELDSVTLNLAGDEAHFLKLGVAVETPPDLAEPPPTAPVYDVIIDLFADYTYTDLLDLGVRDRTKEQLLERLGVIYGDSIVRVYYTEFVMQ